MNATKPTYEALEEICKDLESKVAQNFKVKQALYAAQHDLDAELTRFKLIERFGESAMRMDSSVEFREHAVESFISTFNEPKCVFVELEGDQFVIKNSFGYNESMAEEAIPVQMSYLSGERVSKVIPVGHFLLQSELSTLDLVEAIICPFFNSEREVVGFIICGRSLEEKPFYNSISLSILSAFTIMTQKVGSLYSIIQEKEALKGEIETRKSIEAELERRVKARTSELEAANSLLEKEIDDRKKIELELEHSNVELKRSNSDLKDFAHVVSHDLKTPLRNVGAYVGLTKKRLKASITEETSEYFNFIENGVSKMDVLITDLLAYAQISNETQSFRPVPLKDLIEGVVYKMKSTIDTVQATITVGELPTIDGHYTHLSQLFQNFIDNALKFIKKDVKPLIDISAEIKDGKCIVALKDNGIGIPQDKIDKVFSVFQRLHTSQEYQGTGIGLSICKKVIARHKGRVDVTSEVGVGTTFYITLPVQQA